MSSDLNKLTARIGQIAQYLQLLPQQRVGQVLLYQAKAMAILNKMQQSGDSQFPNFYEISAADIDNLINQLNISNEEIQQQRNSLNLPPGGRDSSQFSVPREVPAFMKMAEKLGFVTQQHSKILLLVQAAARIKEKADISNIQPVSQEEMLHLLEKAVRPRPWIDNEQDNVLQAAQAAEQISDILQILVKGNPEISTISTQQQILEATLALKFMAKIIMEESIGMAQQQQFPANAVQKLNSQAAAMNATIQHSYEQLLQNSSNIVDIVYRAFEEAIKDLPKKLRSSVVETLGDRFFQIEILKTISQNRSQGRDMPPGKGRDL